MAILDYDWLKDNTNLAKPMISHKMMAKILKNLKNVFSNGKKGFKKDLPALPPRKPERLVQF